MHVALGSLLRRMDAVEAGGAATAGTSRSSSSEFGALGDAGSLREELSRIQGRLLSVEGRAVEAAHSLAGLAGVPSRVAEFEGRLDEACGKLAAVLGIPSSSSGLPSLPALQAAVRSLERRLDGRGEAAVLALQALSDACEAAGRIAREPTANPLKGEEDGVRATSPAAVLLASRTLLTVMLCARLSSQHSPRRWATRRSQRWKLVWLRSLERSQRRPRHSTRRCAGTPGRRGSSVP
jgi:hypothetical protein